LKRGVFLKKRKLVVLERTLSPCSKEVKIGFFEWKEGKRGQPKSTVFSREKGELYTHSF